VKTTESHNLLNLNNENDSTFNAADFFTSLVDEHFKGNDRFIVKIWQKLHPGKKIEIDCIASFSYSVFI
jgi:hypothetical protein